MPKIVDWEERRDEILAATWRVIARDGIANTTIRAIASEARCSQGILSHYFSDKADILGSALVLSHRRVGGRMDLLTNELSGLAALRAVMLEALPLDAERDLEAQIEVSFWGRVLSSQELRELQHSEFDRLFSRLRKHLVEACDLGELSPALDIDVATHELVVLIDGLSVERVLHPARVPAARQLLLLDRMLAGLSMSAVSERPGEESGARPATPAGAPLKA